MPARPGLMVLKLSGTNFVLVLQNHPIRTIIYQFQCSEKFYDCKAITKLYMDNTSLIKSWNFIG